MRKFGSKCGCVTAALLLALTTIMTLRASEDPKPPDDELTKGLISKGGASFQVDEDDLKNHWTLIAYGDMRFTDPADEKVTNPKVRRWLVAKIAGEHPDAVLLSGDVPYNGSVANDYEVYRQETASWRDSKLRVYPAMGNHELHGEEVREPKNWWGAFPELKGRRWYSVEMGNMYILTVDSNLSLTEGGRQQKWVAEQLAHLPGKTRFVFVSLHHPPVADGIEGNHSHDVRPNEHALALELEKAAAGSKARFIVIGGHIHNYERFEEGGVTYLVSGGGGAKPYPVARTAADKYQEQSDPNYHYLKFVWDGKVVKAEMFRVKDPAAAKAEYEVKDGFTIEPAQ